jgi:histidyl-tRNA synthetase
VNPVPLDAFVVDTTGGSAARDLTTALRAAGLSADRAFDDRSMKAQFKSADRSGARWVLIVGPDEAASGTVSLRPLRGEGDQQIVPVAEVVDAVRRGTVTPLAP